MASRKRERYNSLRLEHFTPHESRQLCVVPKNTPALQAVRESRIERWARFEKIAATKISNGKWRRNEVAGKWLKNLSRMYSINKWRVKEGPVGNQPKMIKGSPNPWAMYRSAEKAMGGPGSKGYVSPWEIAQLAKGTTRLEKGLIFVQHAEKRAKKEGGVNPIQIKQWIVEKDAAISAAKGKRKQQLIVEKNRLERML